MSQNPNPESGDIASELRDLGKNLVDALHAAWESPERKRLQQELQSGLTELGATLNKEVEHFSSSPTGQRLRSDVKDVGERIRSGEVSAKAREEMISALRTFNAELEKLSQQLAGKDRSPGSQEAPPPGQAETPPGDEGAGSPTKEA